MNIPFVDRKRELAMLDGWFHRKQAGLFVLYGRRRVGKTRLLTHWLTTRAAGRPDQYWMASTQSAHYQLRDISQQLVRLSADLGHPLPAGMLFASWEAVFAYLGQLAEALAPRPFVFVLDEFTYLVQSDPAIASLLQRTWDRALAKISNLRLILSGSMVSVMSRQVIGGRAPLYGRSTGIFVLRPLPYGALVELFPKWTAPERVAVYAVCGGIPAYLDVFAGATGFEQGLINRCLVPASIMLSDAVLMLSERLDDTHVYESVLATIASGFHAWGEIAKISGVSETGLGKYLTTLEDLELVQRRTPVLAPMHNRRGLYHIADPFLRFYYRFLLPHRRDIQQQDTARVRASLMQDLRAFIGAYVFEELAREWVSTSEGARQLGFVPETSGSYWSRRARSSVQLDIVAVDSREKKLLIGEAKWGDGQVSRAVLDDLLVRGKRMAQASDAKWTTRYAVFARNGFSDSARVFARSHNMILVTLSDMEHALVTAVTPKDDQQQPFHI
jgi:hypothetical protein